MMYRHRTSAVVVVMVGMIAPARLACLWLLLYYEIGHASSLRLLPLVLINYPELFLYHWFQQVPASAYGVADVIVVSAMVLLGSIVIGIVGAMVMKIIACRFGTQK